MSRVFMTGGRWVCKTRETYRGITFDARGTSRVSKAEARAAWDRCRQRRMAAIDGQLDRQEGRQRLSDAMGAWYDMYKSQDGRTDRTQHTDRATLRQIAAGPLGGMQVADITADDIQRWLLDLSRTYSQSTLRKVYRMMSMYYRHRDPAGSGPMGRCTIPRARHQPVKHTAYSDDDIAALDTHLRQPYDPHQLTGPGRGTVYGPLLLTILYQYLRYGEAVELRVRDVDMQAGILHVWRQWDPVTYRVRAPKYGSSRDMPIAAQCRDILAAAVAGKGPDDLLWRPRWAVDRSQPSDGHIREPHLLDALRRACGAAGVPVHTIHDLRHDGISYWIRRGIPAQWVSRFAGHRSLTVTLDRYYRDTATIDHAIMSAISGDHMVTAQQGYADATKHPIIS